MDELNRALTLIGATALLIGLLATVLRRTLVTAPLVATMAGVLLGPATGLLGAGGWHHPDLILEETARITLGFGVIEVALRLPADRLRGIGRVVLVLLGGVMPIMWLTTALLAWLVLGTGLWMSLLIGAVLTPTDPITASAIVNGHIARQNVPERIRLALSAESGANDGLALAFLMLPLLVLTGSTQVGVDWLVRVLLWQIVGAVALGAGLGYAAGRLWALAEASKRLDAPTVMMYSLVLALVVLGFVRWMGSDGVLAVFAAGLTLDRQISQRAKSEERIQQAVTRFLSTPAFVLLGVLLPIEGWRDLGWPLLLFAALVLVFRRLPAVFALAPLTGRQARLPEKLFVGWFGPLGVASVFYAELAARRLGNPLIWHATSLVVITSLLAHGGTGAWAANRFGRYGRE